jgi:lipopolysaccharide/colanic/teichoic acid biosynthesis glycosyltransferase
MKIWPVLLDSQPTYLSGRGRSGSLLLIPLGTHTLIEQLRAWLEPLTGHAPLVVSRGSTDPEYGRWIRAVCPTASVVTTAEETAEVAATYELSDALLIVDPRCLPLRAIEFSSLVRHYSAEPRVSHHLVAFESAVAGTQERVSFDTAGHVRRILRHYDPATWPFIAGVAATLLPVASGILGDGVIPTSLADLRLILAARGVPSRDVPVQCGALDLTEEAGLLAANEHFVRKATGIERTGSASATPLYIASGHSIHKTARITGPVVIHPDAHVEENAMVFGPAVIGAGARIASGAVVAHAVVGPDCTVPSGSIVRNRVWFETVGESARPDHQPLSYSDGLVRLMAEARSHKAGAYDDRDRIVRGVHVPPKRVLDVTVAALALVVFSPVLLAVAVAVWLESRGSILYGDEREGLGGRVFRCWKFRTMYAGAHAAQMDLTTLDKMDGPHFKIDRDPRVTRVGRLLRALNLDELPQLFNVLFGEMSLVGPRPSPFRENQVCVPWREARLSVRPGITGFWQVCRHNRSSGDFHQWIEYDLLYVQHISFWLDLKILVATLLTLGGKAGHVASSRLVASASVERDMGPASLKAAHSTARTKQIVPT